MWPHKLSGRSRGVISHTGNKTENDLRNRGRLQGKPAVEGDRILIGDQWITNTNITWTHNYNHN